MESITPLAGKTRPTLGDVAREAGVSAASASRALNGRAQSSATTTRILGVVERLGYTPNAAARSLRLRRTQQIGLAVPDISNPVYGELMRAIDEVAAAEGYRLVLYSTGGRQSTDEEIIRTISDQHVDGLILVSLRGGAGVARALKNSTSPVVLIGERVGRAALDSIHVDSTAAARLAVDHLIEQGRTRIGFVGADLASRPGSARLRGFESAVRAAGLGHSPRRVAPGDFLMSSGETGAVALMATDIDGLLCANDMVAIGALKALRNRDVDVPGQVALVGIDDTFLGTLTTPSISSVSLRTAERGRRAAQLLLARLRDPTRDVERVVVQPQLVVRESSIARAGRPAHLRRRIDERIPSDG